MKAALAMILLIGLAAYAAEGSTRKTLAPAPAPTGRTSTPQTNSAKSSPAPKTMAGPPRGTNSKSSSSGARAQNSQAQLCHEVHPDEYCGHGEQFNCCKSATSSSFNGCVLWDNLQHCDPRLIPICCY